MTASRRHPRAAAALGALLLATLALAPGGCRRDAAENAPAQALRPARAPAAAPPVVLICVDTLRRDHVDAYRPRGLTPALAALASEGVVFERVVAASSWTLPSVASVMTGLDPAVHGAGRRVVVQRGASLPEFLRRVDAEHGFVRFERGAIYRFSALRSDVETLAERMASRYRSHAVHSNITLSSVGGVLDQGFDSVDYGDDLSAAEVTARALAWLRDVADGPVFLYAHYMEPHRWLDELRGEGGERRRAAALGRYAALVRRADAGVGELLRGLRELGLYDETLIVFYSDHGEHFWDDASGTLYGHGNTLHGVAIHVPLLVKFPRGELAGRRVRAPVKLTDVFATVLAEAGLEAPDGGRVDLRSLRAAAEESWSGSERVLVSDFTNHRDELLALERGDYKALHNLSEDRWSLRRAADDAPLDASRGAAATALAELREAARRHREHAARWAAPPEPIEVTREQYETLRQLGYVR